MAETLNSDLDDDFLERFFGSFGRSKDDACWEWNGKIGTRGYGTISFGRKTLRAHRVALQLKLGRPIRRGMFACHECDNPSCVNPAHLWEGTCAQNNADRHAKGRTVINMCPPEKKSRGERHGLSRLTASQVLEIRASSESKCGLARRYGVSDTTIRRIISRRMWAHV